MKRVRLLYILSILIVGTAACNNSSNNENKPILKKIQDSLTYETITLVKSIKDCEISDAECTYVLFTYPQITSTNTLLQKSIKKIIADFLECTSLSNLDSVQQLLLNQYNAYTSKNKTYNQAWNWQKEIFIVYQNGRWVSFKFEFSSYTGGAHPLLETRYITLNKQNGKTLQLTDFISKKSLPKFMQLAETSFRKEYAINPNQTLNDKGFLFPNNTFLLPENYLLTNEGLTFFYNKYEVAPGSLGALSFTIPAPKLAPFLFKK